MIRHFWGIFFLSLISISFAIECGKSNQFSSRVFNGQATDPGDWPWLASLFKIINGKYFCGSSLISESLLVTGVVKIFLKL
jgi:secreted trypsin-like serine protease